LGTYPAVDPNMYVYYHYNNNSLVGENDTYVYDFSGKGDNGTVYGTPMWDTTGGFLQDGGFDFDGLNDYIQIYGNIGNPISTAIITSDAFTFSIWVKLGVQSASGNIIRNRDECSLKSLNDGTVRANCKYDGAYATELTAGVLERNKWYHIVYTANASYGHFLYVNGILVDNISLSASDVSLLNNWDIGRRSTGAEFLNASVDEAIIYDSFSTLEQVQQMYYDYNSLYVDSSVTFPQSVYELTGNPDDNGVIFVNGSDLTIDCNNSIFYGGNTSYWMNITNQNNITVKNCKVYGYYTGINGYNVSNSTFKDNYFENISGYAAIYLYGKTDLSANSNNNLIENNVINNSRNGVSLQLSTINNTIQNNRIYNSTYHGINLFVKANYNTIYNNSVERCWNNGIGILVNRDCHYNVVDNNYVENTVADGIQVRGYETVDGKSTYNNISNNVVVNASWNCPYSSGSCAQGFFFNWYSDYNYIVNNSVIQSHGNCFETTLYSNNNTFINNTGTLCEGHGLEINGNNSAYSYNNRFDGEQLQFNSGSYILGYTKGDSGTTFLDIVGAIIRNDDIDSEFTVITNPIVDEINITPTGISFRNFTSGRLNNTNASGVGTFSLNEADNVFVYLSNGSVIQGTGTINVTLQAGDDADIINQWDGTINTTLNRVYYDPITFNGNMTITGNGTAIFYNNLIFPSTNQYIFQLSGSTYALGSGGSING